MEKNLEIVITYSWKDKDFVDKIDKDFQAVGITFIRDERDIKFMASIKEHTQRISAKDFVFILVSDSFLKSTNCMYEIMEYVKELSYTNKILPIILENARISNLAESQEYIKYWQDEYSKQLNELKDLPPSALVPAGQNLRHLENIKDNVGKFIDVLQNMKTVPYDELKRSEYTAIMDCIGYSEDKLLKMLFAINSISETDEKNEAINKFIEKNPYYSKGYHLRGIYDAIRRKYVDSIDDFTMAIELDNNFTEAYYNRGFVHYQRGDRDKAIEDLHTAARLGSARAEAMLKEIALVKS